jgi:hypothetical protein
MAAIFISYRRADSDGWAGRLRDTLRVRFGDRVFQDVENIADGEIFSEVIERALKACDVALVIIGPNWASARNESGRRLDQPDDWVRTETSLVLNRQIRVIPVLVGGASMPRAEDLPEDLRSLTKRQAREIRSNSWDSDVALLTNHLRQIVDRRRKKPVWLYALAPLVVVTAIGVIAGRQFFGQPALTPTPAEPTASRAAAPETARPIKAEPAPPPPTAVAAQASPVSAAGTTITPGKSPIAAPAAPERPQPKVARTEPPPPKAAAAPVQEPRRVTAVPVQEPRRATAVPVPEPRRPATALAAAEAPPSRTAATAPVAPEVRPPEPPPAAPAAAPVTVARAASLNLPNRPASARELKVGDSWTYRLREVSFDRTLATVTHEIGGGDKGGIREMVRLGGRKPGVDPGAEASGGSAGAATQRRLALEPRIFEQQINQNARLIEFAPFMTAFSELQPGVKWNKIAGATSTDSISDWRFSGKVAGRERVRVPAGSFDAIKAELEGELDISFPSTRDAFNEPTPSYQTYSIWFVPEVGRAVKYERRTYNRGRRLLDHEQYELVSYQLK